ncbi:hypothetical protein GCM10027047_01500 [Rhodococcus aerolatus]
MAGRDHARVYLSIWDDDDFVALSPNAQHLYFVLLTSEDLTYCGVADWRPRRIAKRSRGWTPQHVEAAAAELQSSRFVVVDEDSEEVLLRSFVRRDGLMRQPNMATSMARAARAVVSRPIRRALVHELRRLHTEQPDLKGWGSKDAAALLDRPSEQGSGDPTSDPSVDPTDDPPSDPPVDPSVEGEPKGSDDPRADPSPTPYSLLPTHFSPLPAPLGQVGSEGDSPARETTPRPMIDPANPRCSTHREVPATERVPACAACAAARRLVEEDRGRQAAAKARQRQDRDQAIARCPACDEAGWVELDGGTVTRCDHRAAVTA